MILTNCYIEELRWQGMKKEIHHKHWDKGLRENWCYLELKYLIHKDNLYWSFKLTQSYNNTF